MTDILNAPKGAKRVKLPVNPYLSDLFFNYDKPGAWNEEKQQWDFEKLTLAAVELLAMLEGVGASKLSPPHRLVEDFIDRV